MRKRKKIKISASHKVGAIEVVDNIQGVPPPAQVSMWFEYIVLIVLSQPRHVVGWTEGVCWRIRFLVVFQFQSQSEWDSVIVLSF